MTPARRPPLALLGRALRSLSLTLVLAHGAAAAQVAPQGSAGIAKLEDAYADFNDAAGAISLIDSDPASYTAGYAGRSRTAWQGIYDSTHAQLVAGLAAVAAASLPAGDARALEVMRAALAEGPESFVPVGHCSDARRADLDLAALHDALYACFDELGNHLQFEGAAVTRVAAFELLTRIGEPERRKALFMAFVPLWRALNGDGGRGSPYRRMLPLAAAELRRKGSPIDAAAHTVGASSAEVERWLERILDAWRQVSGSAPVEPWDYRFASGAAEREVAAAIPREALRPLSARFYRDLGLDIASPQVIYDLEPRPGKAPLAYTEFVRRGRVVAGTWQPTIVRISAVYENGGLGPLNELVHEQGHVTHVLALHTRPAFMGWEDSLFDEAVADVPSWSVYEPAWQRKYLGRSAGETASLRSLYSAVMLEVAWGLFDLRMLRAPTADPNRVWTEITQRYLHVRPHPELAWWAARVQLVDQPGYLVNYGLGAVITADVRQRIVEELGPFDAGNERWFGWLGEHLLASGDEIEAGERLRRFLGRPVSPEALLRELQRIPERE